METDRADKKKKRNINKKSWHGPTRPTIPTRPLLPEAADELPNQPNPPPAIHPLLPGRGQENRQAER